MEDDLRICSVKPAFDSERRFCFEVLSPTKYDNTLINQKYMNKQEHFMIVGVISYKRILNLCISHG